MGEASADQDVEIEVIDLDLEEAEEDYLHFWPRCTTCHTTTC